QGVSCGSLIGWIRNMLGVEGLSYLTVDEPELVGEIIETNADLCYRCLEATLERVDCFDYAHYWEDICFNHGPLVNPAFFREQIAPWYRKATTLLAKHEIRLVSVDCDGCIDALVPIWLEAGVNVMFPIEVGTWNASIAPWRAAYGDAVKGVGGVKKSVFSMDKAAIDAEIERLKPLIDLGGYIPCPDHRIPPDAKWELVQYYTDRLGNLKI
ncbi:MAG TPA: uroporphyrinogen decarboxylase family protein, partial [Oceanipulchritudo sp.]|nr:uroporphyrinogen decarboxylase family protein [Oceanipulchritudo sp.]